MIKAVIFDCFGVIIGRGFEHTYRMAGGDPQRDRSFIEAIIGQANLGMISEADFNQGIADQLGISQAEWRAAMYKAEQPDTQLLEYIEAMRGPYKTALLSNANHGSVAARIGNDWMERCFDAIVVSAEVGMAKPDPRIYQYAADMLKAQPSECVFFDDIERMVEPARELGMHAFVYTNLAQAKTDIQQLLA